MKKFALIASTLGVVGLISLTSCMQRPRQTVENETERAARNAEKAAEEELGVEDKTGSARMPGEETTDTTIVEETTESMPREVEEAREPMPRETEEASEAQPEEVKGMADEPQQEEIPFANLSTEEVRTLQNALNAKGAKIAVDGIVGPETQKAIEEFQTENGLPASGKLTAATADQLGISGIGLAH